MKQFLLLFILFVMLGSCYVHRLCPLKSCQVQMEHKHGAKTFNSRKIFKVKIHYLGEKIIREHKKEQKLQRERRKMEKQRN